MSEALKCDLCGSFFDKSARQTDVPGILMGVSPRYSTERFGRVKNLKYDLCDNCLNTINKCLDDLRRD